MRFRPNRDGTRSAQSVHVWSVSDDGTDLVRFMGPLSGLILHYQGKKPVVCQGQGLCPMSLHRQGPTWKGYAACEVFEQAHGLWFPWVFECTENLEHLLRGRTLRGEVWGMEREKRAGERSAVTGFHIETVDVATLRTPFPIEPVLRRMYHADNLVLGVPNPLPAKVFLAPSEGGIPSVLSQVMAAPMSGPPVMSQEERAEKLRRMMGQRGSSSNVNGKAPSANGQSGGHS